MVNHGLPEKDGRAEPAKEFDVDSRGLFYNPSFQLAEQNPLSFKAKAYQPFRRLSLETSQGH